MIDTHAHIYLPEFEKDRENMLQSAEKDGVERILMPAIDSSTHESMLELEKKHPSKCLAMMGVHPCSIKADYRGELETAATWLVKKGFVAVGEIGLDLYWDKTFFEEQKQAFREQIGWALQYDLPIVIHSREAIDECIEIVKENQQGQLRGVFHCFSGNLQQAKQIIDLGFYLGIGGVITFKNAGLDKVMEEVSLDHVVLETDAPYLAPVPYRGKRNEPSYLKYVVEKLSIVKKISKEEISKITTENAIELFRLTHEAK